MQLIDAFENGAALCAYCASENCTIAEAMIRREVSRGEMMRDAIIAEMRENLNVMRESVRIGLEEHVETVSHLSGGEAMRLFRYAKYDPFSGGNTCRAAASAMAVCEVNSSMGRIVAAPTAGASGILPGVLIECGRGRLPVCQKRNDLRRGRRLSGRDRRCQRDGGSGDRRAFRRYARAIARRRGDDDQKHHGACL